MTIKAQNAALSFLPRIRVQDKLQQEPRFLDGLGFRSKCGMTARRADDGEIDAEFEYDFEKTKPICRGPNEHKLLFNKGL